MLNHSDIMSTVDMIDHQHLDIRTITMGISLLDCADPNPEALSLIHISEPTRPY